MITSRSLLVVLATIACAGSHAAESVEPLPGRAVTLKIPSSVLETKVTFFASLNFTARVSKGSTGVLVEGDAEWSTSGFPSMFDGTIKKVKRIKADNLFRVVVRNESSGLKITLDFPGATQEELPALLGEVVVSGRKDDEPATTYLAEAYSLLAEKMFTGPLSELEQEKQIALVKFAHITAAGTRVGSEVFKEQVYLVVDLGTDSSVYNTLQLDQAERVAKIVNERLLTILKAFSLPVQETPFIFGLKIELRIPHKSFIKEYAAPDYDSLEMFVPSSIIRKFADLEITSQELIDNAVVIVNSNRIAVPLAG